MKPTSTSSLLLLFRPLPPPSSYNLALLKSGHPPPLLRLPLLFPLQVDLSNALKDTGLAYGSVRPNQVPQWQDEAIIRFILAAGGRQDSKGRTIKQ